MKLMICGYGRHGKDTVADIISQRYMLPFLSSSLVAARLMFDRLRGAYGYSTVEECYADRASHRDKWFQGIAELNTPDKTRLAALIYESSDIYCGMRCADELSACLDQSMIDLCVWVDASRRLPPEPLTSCTVTSDMCDITVTNNGSLDDLHRKVCRVFDVILSPAECYR